MWGGGYVTDIAYTAHYFHHIAPSHIDFILTMKGLQASASDASFDYMELGCGHGLTTLILAAAYPRARFWANDFNPAHIQRARRIAAAAGLANVTFLETAFADLAAAGLPEMDYVSAHGIYSWVTEDNQNALVAFAGDRLKPGGIFSVSYNIMPGWSPLAPLQWLARAYADGLTGPSDRRMAQSIQFLEGLAATGAGYFAPGSRVGPAVEKMKAGAPSYVAHEYLNAAWHLLTHHAVAERLAAVKLAFAASADTPLLVERLVLPDVPRKAVEGLSGHPLRETVIDYLRGNNFRRDIFVKGGMRMRDQARERAIARQPLALVRPRAACKLEAPFPVGNVKLAEQPHARMLDRLAEGPATVGELAGAPSGEPLALGIQALLRLAAAGHVTACALGWAGSPDPDAVEATRRLNRVLLDPDALPERAHVLASPVTGGGVAVPADARAALQDGGGSAEDRALLTRLGLA
ncbi:MAG: methyltransferase regulatory domain-containing protein [Alphaproteobacteria bacterium]